MIERSLLMGSDYYEQFDECEIYADCLPIGVGRGTHVSGGRGGPGGRGGVPIGVSRGMHIGAGRGRSMKDEGWGGMSGCSQRGKSGS